MRISAHGRGAFLTVPALSLLTACSIFEVRPNFRAELTENRARWEAAGIADYTVRFQRLCVFCSDNDVRPVRLTVLQGVIEDVYDLDAEQTLTEWPPGQYLTIVEVFDFIQAALDQQAAQIRVTYDDQLGYPTDVAIDFSRRYIDDDTDFLIQDLLAS